MSKVSTLRKLGVAANVARKQAGRSNTLKAITAGARATMRSFGHALHQLWLEVIGSVFLSIAAFGVFACVREYIKYSAKQTTAGHVAVAVCFTLAFAWFGLSSFTRTRRKSRP